jgi:hypothetical protein
MRIFSTPAWISVCWCDWAVRVWCMISAPHLDADALRVGMVSTHEEFPMSSFRTRSACMIVAALWACTPSVQAESTVVKGVEETQLTLTDIPTLRVSPHGFGPGGSGGGGGGIFQTRTCNVVSSLTTASFTGGTYTLQAGFSQNEGLAATYTVPAGEWPIKITLSECIFATSAASVQTTTEWRIEYWSGTPTAGTLVDFFESDGDLLPHIVIPPGTNGVNLNFSIDPGDPDQIFIPNNGSNLFTVVWKVLRHNNPSANPCTTPNPTGSNAFPVTDNTSCNPNTPYAQLNFPNDNWLFGVNCGPFGCPPNGGWARFSTLSSAIACINNSGCRPRGDWVTRTTWSGIDCTPGNGACCLPNGSCSVLPNGDCLNAGGIYQGDGTSCLGVTCPQPTGACCVNNGAFCLNNITPSDCAGIPGIWQGAGSTCNVGNSCPTGGCCLPSGQCTVTTSANCAAQNGVFRGSNTTCSGANCPQPSGACCFASGTCISLTSANCTGAGGSWGGAGTNCTAGCGPTCDTLDFNRDTLFPDSQDLDDLIAVLGGGPGACSNFPNCGDIDFNNDGLFPDSTDLDAYISRLSGGPCL